MLYNVFTLLLQVAVVQAIVSKARVTGRGKDLLEEEAEEDCSFKTLYYLRYLKCVKGEVKLKNTH